VFEPKVTLDQASFRALASETRVAILRALAERQMTLTELAERLGISKPGVMKHLELLQEAGLVLRDTPERKWIYYRLTTKGERILDPNKTRIMLALGFSVFAILLGLLPLVLAAIGALAAFSSAITYRRARSASDEEILSRLAEVLEESPGAAPAARVQQS